MKFQSLGCVVFTFAGLVSGCAPGNEQDSLKSTASYWRNVKYKNSDHLNGVGLNGASFFDNGVGFNGVGLNGVGLNGVGLNGVGLNGGDLQNIIQVDNVPVVDKSGEDLIGARMLGITTEDPIPMVIDNIIVDAPNPNLYFFSFVDVDENNDIIPNSHVPACTDENDDPVPAVLLSGAWNDATGARTTQLTDVITIACVNGAIGKCVSWGYPPWQSQQECLGQDCSNKSLDDWHQACTRMVRADYCGNGAHHTESGTSINVWDNFGIQAHGTPGSEYTAEAEWTQSGARCIKKTRWNHRGLQSNQTDYEYVRNVCPERLYIYDRHCETSGYCSGTGGGSTACTVDADCNCNVLACPNTDRFTCNTGSGHCVSNDACGSTTTEFGSSSDFFSADGYSTLTSSTPTVTVPPLAERRVLRNETRDNDNL
jgi:hypothetical protein